MKFGVEQNVDVVFASFIRKASDVAEIKAELGEKGKHIRIVSKVEYVIIDIEFLLRTCTNELQHCL